MRIQSLINREPAEGSSDHQVITTEVATPASGTTGVTSSGQQYVQVDTPNPKLGGGIKESTGTKQEVLAPKTNAPVVRMPEALKGTEFSLEDPLENKPADKPSTTQNNGKETKPAAAQEPSSKPEDDLSSFEVEEPTTKKPATQQQPEVIEGSKRGISAGERDYSGFQPEIVAALKKTPNESFATISKVIREQQKQLAESKQFKEEISKGGFPEKWYDHPQAYTLHPDYQQLSALTEQARVETDFWKEQLVNVRNNKPWRTLKSFDPRTFQPVPSAEEYKPDAGAEAHILERMQIGQAKISEFQTGIQQVAGNFNRRMSIIDSMYSKVVEERFPWVKDEKDSRQKYIPEFLKAVPVEIADQHGTKLAALMFAQLQKANEIIRQQRATIDSGKFEQQEEKRIEPTITKTSPNTVTNAPVRINGGKTALPSWVPREFSLEGMD